MGTAPAIIDPHLSGIANSILRTAESVGVPIQYLGNAPLFPDVRLYRGLRTDWILSPADLDAHAATGMVMPRSELAKLQKLVEAKVDFPAVYIAHEVNRDSAINLGIAKPGDHDHSEARTVVKSGHALVSADSFVVIEPEVAAQAIEAPPAPPRTAKVSRGLGKVTGATMRATAKVAPIVAGVALAPVIAAGALAAFMPMDPIIFGAMTADGDDAPGTPAAFFVLCQWDW